VKGAQVNRKTRRGNRLGLFLTGLVLTLLGLYSLLRGLGALPRSWARADTPIADGPVQSFFAGASPWIWWAVAALSIVVALLGLRWLLVQGRRESRESLRLEAGPGGVTDVTGNGLAGAVASDAEYYPVVLGADAALAGRRDRPEVRMRLAADENAPMSAVREHLADVTIPHLRDTLDVERVPVVARITLEPPQAPTRVVR
jgi:hypothetical protein